MMPQHKNALIYTFSALVVFGGLTLFFQTRQERREKRRTPIVSERAPIAVPTPVVVPVPVVTTTSHANVFGPSLVAAMQLLPVPEASFHGRKISETKYWIWAKQDSLSTGEEWNNEDQLWIVDVKERKATMLKTRKFGVPDGPKMDDTQTHPSEKYFFIEWSAVWEGVDEVVTDVIDRTTGKLLYSFQRTNVGTAYLEEGERKLEIALDSKDGCDRAGKIRKISVKGLHINGKLMPFAAPLTITCAPYNDFLGLSFHPFVDSLEFFEVPSVIRLILPGGLKAEFPVPGLDATKVRYSR